MFRPNVPGDGFLDIGTVKEKAIKAPDLYNYNNNPGECKVWRERFRTHIKTQHMAVPWNFIFDACEIRKADIITEEDVVTLLYNARIRKSDREVVESTLYSLMSQSLKLQSLERLTTAGSRNVFDQYRQLFYEGLNITELSLFNAKGKIWRAPEAKSA